MTNDPSLEEQLYTLSEVHPDHPKQIRPDRTFKKPGSGRWPNAFRITPEQEADVKRMWGEKMSIGAIARVIGCGHWVVRGVLERAGMVRGKIPLTQVRVMSVNPYTGCMILSNDLRIIKPPKHNYKPGDIWTETSFTHECR